MISICSSLDTVYRLFGQFHGPRSEGNINEMFEKSRTLNTSPSGININLFEKRLIVLLERYDWQVQVDFFFF